MNTHLESYLTLTDNSKLMYTGYEIYECISTKEIDILKIKFKLWDIILDDNVMHTTATRNMNSVQ